MAEIELFHYRKGNGILHRFNGGFKLLAMIFLSIAIFRGEVNELILLSLFISVVFLIEYSSENSWRNPIANIVSPIADYKN